jgi:hypothetical protein
MEGWSKRHPKLSAIGGVIMLIGGGLATIQGIWNLFSNQSLFPYIAANVSLWPKVLLSVIFSAIAIFGIVLVIIIFRRTSKLGMGKNTNATLTSAPIQPPSALYIEAHVEGFGQPDDAGYPPSDDNTILWIRIYLLFNVLATMLIESVKLDILGNYIPDLNWKSMEVNEPQPIGYSYFALPSTITSGQHSAKILAFAEGKWWPSKPFPVDVPKR